jgi:5-methylcytosine-specific restriction endonuclease McrA
MNKTWTPEQKKWLKKYLKPHIDKVWGWWPVKNEVRKRAIGTQSWLQICNHCKLEFRRDETEIDHIVPTVEVEKEGFNDPGLYIDRKFVQIDELQVLCKECHKKKTTSEAGIRAQYRRVRKQKPVTKRKRK